MQGHADYVPFLAFEERVQARREVMATDNGAGLAEHERHQLLGEHEDPESLAWFELRGKGKDTSLPSFSCLVTLRKLTHCWSQAYCGVFVVRLVATPSGKSVFV